MRPIPHASDAAQNSNTITISWLYTIPKVSFHPATRAFAGAKQQARFWLRSAQPPPVRNHCFGIMGDTATHDAFGAYAMFTGRNIDAKRHVGRYLFADHALRFFRGGRPAKGDGTNPLRNDQIGFGGQCPCIHADFKPVRGVCFACHSVILRQRAKGTSDIRKGCGPKRRSLSKAQSANPDIAAILGWSAKPTPHPTKVRSHRSLCENTSASMPAPAACSTDQPPES